MGFTLLRKGSSKDILGIDEETIAFRNTNHFSVFDVGRSKDKIPGKAKAITACAVKSFDIASILGIPTHFIEQLDDVTIRVKKANTIENRYIAGDKANYIIPVEFIYRLFEAGSLHRGFVDGTKNPKDYGLPADEKPRVGRPLPYIVHHPTTKFEAIDRDISSNNELCLMSGMTMDDLAKCWSMIDHFIGAVRIILSNAGFVTLDGKLELRMNERRAIEIADVTITPDEDRPVPKDKLEQGIIEHYSKEYLREYFIKIGYFKALKAARATNQSNIPLPPLPADIIEEASKRYIVFAEAYSGTKISI